MPDMTAAAACNNAAWVDAVARSHGVPTRHSGGAWRADGRMPPFYPNLVTLDRAAEAGVLVGDPPRGAPAGWGLKDSFATLDLAAEGFVPVFEASWIVLAGSPERSCGAARVTTPEGLARWVRGWGETPQGAAIFVPALLDAPGVRFYAAEADSGATAGLAALLDDEVAGFSNAFGPAQGIAACLAALAGDAGARPIVGYERGTALREMTALGFRPVGPLRVWGRAGAT
jgi:hypothetical protein